MIVVDSSAVVAALTDEPAAQAITVALDRAAARIMSAATLVELGLVLEGNRHRAPAGAAERFVREARIRVLPVDAAQAHRALEGWRRFGKGRHPAGLNLGDCFTYALASTRNLPVLCTGNDFAQTDVQVVALIDPIPDDPSDD